MEFHETGFSFKNWCCFVFMYNVILWYMFFFGNDVVEAYIYRSSLTVTLLHSQGFCLCSQVTLDLTLSHSLHFAMSNMQKLKKAKSAMPSYFLIFWKQLKRFSSRIVNWLVKPVCFVNINDNLTKKCPSRRTFSNECAIWGNTVILFFLKSLIYVIFSLRGIH